MTAHRELTFSSIRAVTRAAAVVSPHTLNGVFWCAGKVTFDTFALADMVATRSRKRRNASGQEAYHCDQCGKYHVGSDFRKAGGR